MKILLVDDDLELGTMLSQYLIAEGFETQLVLTGSAGIEGALSGHYTAMILDIMLPDMSGIDVLRQVRQNSRRPVIMLTAKGDNIDRVIGLEMGADDYLAKPFDPRELLARVRALLRRQDKLRTQVASELRFDGWRLLPDQRRLFAPDGAELVLSRGEFSLLLALAERPGRVLGREQLLQLSRGEASDSVDRAIDLAISRLRRKLGQAASGAEALVQTLRGEGYRFDAEVQVL